MRYRQFLEKELVDIVDCGVRMPSGYHLIGHVALVKIDDNCMPYAQLIGNATLRYNSRIRSVAVRTGRTVGQMRLPSYLVVAGSEQTLTTHVENGIRYTLDPTVVTFSGGNRWERARLLTLVGPSETIVDMFACVGQFSLPLAKHRGARVISIEINPVAHAFLTRNVVINHLNDRVSTILGDCREVHPTGIADRVIMGYLHDTVEFLESALKCLRPKGGSIHMHQAIVRDRIPVLLDQIAEICDMAGFVSSVSARKVKNYSKGVIHMVFDIVLRPHV
ncbi:MAG: class I SAM-dependent methyltransferase family protein [Candidatus Thorarchaeota archaeon]